MKKEIFILLLVICTVRSYAQAGDLLVGATGGYITHYEDPLYGLNVSYHLNDPIELSLSGLLNPNVTRKDEIDDSVDKLNLLSLNLDLHYYMMLMRSWATGPVLGVQYLSITDKEASLGDANVTGFNIGWHMRGNISDTMKVFGGWRYTMAGNEYSHHYFYVGVGYTFSLF